MKQYSALILILFSCAVGYGQSASLKIIGGTGSPGLPVVTRVYIDHTVDCEAFSFGVIHDPTLLSVTNIQRGYYLEGSNLGGINPDYLMLESDPLNGPGFIVGCLLDMSPPINDLLAGIDQELIITTYTISPTAPPGVAALQFSSGLHDPPVMLLVVMGGLEYTPDVVNGDITIIDDCNGNGSPDDGDIANGTSIDCDLDGVPDECGYAPGQVDCDLNGIPDICQDDCNQDGIADTCQAALDCDLDGVLDSCEIAAGTSSDCDADGLPDDCAIVQGLAGDCDGDGILDNCEIVSGTQFDCDLDALPDDCALAQGLASDCDGDGVLDGCEIASGTDSDCDVDGIPDSCALAQGLADDCDQDGQIDSCEIAQGLEGDCDLDGLLDSCEIQQGLQADCDGDGLPDDCALAQGIVSDCDADGLLDSCEIVSGSQLDCDSNGTPDDCAIASGLVEDCDLNAIPDGCDIAAGGDANNNGTLDVCEIVEFRRGDCNGSGVFNIADAIIVLNYLFGLTTAGTGPDACDPNDDGDVNIADAVFLLSSLFAGGPLPSLPYPDCGVDDTIDALDCESYSGTCP